MEPRTAARPLALLSALFSLMIAPAPSTTDSVVGARAVCASGTYCAEPTSICFDDRGNEYTNYYFTSGGLCDGS